VNYCQKLYLLRLKMLPNNPPEGILLIDKPPARTSFFAVAMVRKKTQQKKIGHTGTLDPFATGLLVLLLGRSWTKKANLFLEYDKEYEATFCLGKATDTYDCDGKITHESQVQPTLSEVERVLTVFQGKYMQTPPMFSAKKIDGTRLYKLARRGIQVERKSVEVSLETTLLSYSYPYLSLRIKGSKGTYIRSIAQDLGERLGSYAYVSQLRRTQSGPFLLQDALPLEECLSLSLDKLQSRLLRDL
jgi:tRNA pseudouridine55 synthase